VLSSRKRAMLNRRVFAMGAGKGERGIRVWMVMAAVVIVAAIVGAIVIMSDHDACDACACVVTLERDPRYAAVKAFDVEESSAMRATAEARKELGAACRSALDAELRPVLSKILKRALHEAPDRAIVAYTRARWELAAAWARIDPAGCVDALGGGKKARARMWSLWDKLPEHAREAVESADARLLESVRAPGPRSPPFADEEAYRWIVDVAKGPDRSTTPTERCRYVMKFYAAILEMPDPSRVRGLRYIIDLQDFTLEGFTWDPQSPKPDLSDIERYP
jgi:hypothetical protein